MDTLNLAEGLIVCGICAIFCIAQLFRTMEVAKLRHNMIDLIFQNDDYEWRVEVYESVSFGEMMLKFWRPIKVDAFYPNDAFLRADGIMETR